MKTMVLVDDNQFRFSHSMFLDDMRERGHEITIKKADDPSLSLKQHGEFFYDNLILFAPATEEFGGTVDVTSVLEFVDAGHNVLVGVNSDVGEPVREIASECGVHFDSESNSVIDHMSFDKSDFDGDHTLVVAENFNQIPALVGERALNPVLFEGIGASLDPDSRLVMRVLSASPTAYSHNADKTITDTVDISGKSTVLVAALQARNNARMLFSGSMKFFSDEFFASPVTKYPPSKDTVRYDNSGNRQAAKEMTRWAFGERGILRASNVSHHKKGAPPDNGQVYRIGDDVEFSMEIQEWLSSSQRWTPFRADDVQLEFSMLDPYVRMRLVPDGQGGFHASFKAPDVYGVFQFKVNYWRPGYGSISVAEEVLVRPFRHDEFERFIPAAYPYYASTFSMMVGSFVLGAVVLYHKPIPKAPSKA